MDMPGFVDESYAVDMLTLFIVIRMAVLIMLNRWKALSGKFSTERCFACCISEPTDFTGSRLLLCCLYKVKFHASGGFHFFCPDAFI